MNQLNPFAFPMYVPESTDSPETYQEGMRLRDFFAAAALQGLLAGGMVINSPESNAHSAYLIANAMLEARKN